MKIEKNDDWDVLGSYLNAKISFEYGDVVLNNDYLLELCDSIADTFNDYEGSFKVVNGENSILCEIDKEWWDEKTYDGIENKIVEKELIEDVEKVFVKQLILDKGIFVEYGKLLKDELMKRNDERIFDESYIDGASNNYEQILEELTLEKLDAICTKNMKEEMLIDIREDYY